jgi:periplasmic protein CpxP/Spy
VDDAANVERAVHGGNSVHSGPNHAKSIQERWTRKKNLLHAAVIFTVLAGGTAVYAQMGPQQGGGQWGHGPGQATTADQRLQRMTKQLNLSDAQQQLIKPILENEAKQMQTLHEDSSLSQQDRMSKMQQIRQDTSSQLKPILNADQQQKYEQMMSHQGRQGHGGPGQNQPQGQDQPPPQ